LEQFHQLNFLLRTSWFIAKRLLRSGKENEQLSTPIVRIAIGGIALGLSVMIVAVAIVTGFQREIRAKVIGFGSHIQITTYDSNKSFESEPINRNQPFVPLLKKNPDISHIQAYSNKGGIIKVRDANEGILFKGVDKDYDWAFFKSHLKSGRIPAAVDSGKPTEILVSSTMAKSLKIASGSKLMIFFVQDPPKARPFIISGIYDTGLGENDFDKRYVIGDMQVINRLNKWNKDQASGLEVFIKDYKKLNVVDEYVYQNIPPDLNAVNIENQYPQIFGWLELMDTNVYIIVVLMLVVSIINMITSLLIMILERTNMIGVLKAIGADNQVIGAIFLRKSAWMTATGLLFGNLVGIGLCLAQKYTGIIKLNQETYYLNEVPVNLELWHVLALNAGAFSVCMIAMILPVLLVSRISPAKVMRFD